MATNDILNNAFAIGNATVMMAPFATDVFSLTPALHSIGMVKQVSVGMEADTIDLRHGIQQNLVDQKRAGVRTPVTFEGYEFTAQNLVRALGYSNTTIVRKHGTLATALAAAATTASVASAPIPGDATSGITAIGDIPAGSTLIIQKDSDSSYVFPVRTSGAITGAGPYSVTLGSAVPTGMSFAIGDEVWVVNELGIGSQKDTDFFGMKIAGTLSNYDVPVVIILPKVKVVRGFNLNFSETDYGNLPFEVSPFFLAATEATGRLAEIGTQITARAYVGS